MRRVAIAVAVPALLAALWSAPVGAATGQWTLKPGHTVTISNMDINSCNTDFAFLIVLDAGGRQVASPNLGNNNGSTCSDTVLSPVSFLNDSGQLETVKLRLDDTTCGARTYDSDGTGAANHASAFASSASINDGGTGCELADATSRPSVKHGSFNAKVTIK